MNKLKSCAVVGIGNMGRHHVRVCNELNLTTFECDTNKNNLYIRNKENFYSDYKQLIHCNIDFAIIATPTPYHLDIAKFFLKNNIPVLIEKPIFQNVNDYSELENYQDKIMVGHIEQFNPVLLEIKEQIKNKKIISCHFKRVGFYPVRINDNIIIDFAIHDINNSLYLFGEPLTIYGVGNKINDSLCTLAYQDFNILIQTSWNVPYKIREIEVITKEGVLLGDLIKQEVTIENEHLISKIKINKEEPLKTEIQHFVNCLENNKPFKTDFYNAVQTLAIAETIELSNQIGKVVRYAKKD